MIVTQRQGSARIMGPSVRYRAQLQPIKTGLWPLQQGWKIKLCKAAISGRVADYQALSPGFEQHLQPSCRGARYCVPW
ncbi:MAG: hypothetical protein CVV07_09390 [Gammaproteobacteria bacterium HGW-Gammaproteobacteria-11]|nr:MAG: hypothetical protein CVV07_09390 [Gammaproteobacteria bacterium HGW-Gammaproteobacteria-11]